MSGRLWLEAVERELNRRQLPRQEVARLVAELSDHLADVIDSQNAAGLFPARDPASVKSLEDIMEEHMSMEARVAESLGSPAVIAETAVAEFHRRRNLLSRSWLAAFCTFALLPLPALCLAWTLTILSLRVIAEVCEWCGLPGESQREITPLLVFAGHVIMAAIVVGPASLVAALFGRLARKTSHRWRWGLVASLLVALTTALVTTTATFSETPGKSSIMFGVPLSGSAKFWMSLVQPAHFGQFLLPLGVGVLILRRSAGGPVQPAGRQPLSL